MGFNVALLIFGILLLLLGLVGKIKYKDIEAGTDSRIVRIVTASIGILLMVSSFIPDIITEFFSSLIQEPQPTQTSQPTQASQPHPTIVAEEVWFVILGSFSLEKLEVAESHERFLENSGYKASILKTDDYPMLTSGLWVVVMGPYSSKNRANNEREKVLHLVSDAYVKRGK